VFGPFTPRFAGFAATVVLGAVLALLWPAAAEAAPKAPALTGGSPSAPMPDTPRGVIVVAVGVAAREPAKALARLIYGDATLRPKIDELTARALVGEGPRCGEDASGQAGGQESAADAEAETRVATAAGPLGVRASQACSAGLREIRDTIEELGKGCAPSCDAWSVARPMLAGLGLDLGADLVIAVEVGAGPDAGRTTPVARVLRPSERRFVPVLLSAQHPSGGGPIDWSASLPLLRSLLTPGLPRRPGANEANDAGPAPTRGSAAIRGPGAAPSSLAPSDEDEQTRVLSSPWFWGGLGVLVAAGITVFALSRSAGGSETIELDGRVSP
jgi:hypothetical protein